MPFPLELKYIEIAEDQFGLKFPEKYKSKMQQENSGEFRVTFSETTNDDEIEPWWLFPFQDSSEIKRIKHTMNHLVHENQSIQDMSDFPANSVAIAFNDCGDYLLLRSVDEIHLGEEIYLWRQEDSEAIYLLADSINVFIPIEP